MPQVALGLGSNVGDRRAHLHRAIAALHAGTPPLFTSLTASPVYESPALLPVSAPASWDRPYLNMAVRGETSREPLGLLSAIKRIEEDLGRETSGRWSPRIIDIDILAYENQVLESDALTLPHPGLLTRAFALCPLADVWPDWHYPVPGAWQGVTAQSLRKSLPGTDVLTLVASPPFLEKGEQA